MIVDLVGRLDIEWALNFESIVVTKVEFETLRVETNPFVLSLKIFFNMNYCGLNNE